MLDNVARWGILIGSFVVRKPLRLALAKVIERFYAGEGVLRGLLEEAVHGTASREKGSI